MKKIKHRCRDTVRRCEAVKDRHWWRRCWDVPEIAGFCTHRYCKLGGCDVIYEVRCEPTKMNVFSSMLMKPILMVSSPCLMVYIHSLHYESSYSIPIKVCKLYVIPMISLWKSYCPPKKTWWPWQSSGLEDEWWNTVVYHKKNGWF